MFKKFIGATIVAFASLCMTACGQMVEVPQAHVGKIKTKQGLKEGTISPSKFRLEWCWAYCDDLIVLDVSDSKYIESFETYMPKDELMLKYKVSLMLTVDPAKYDFVFQNVPAQDSTSDTQLVPLQTVYQRYAEQRLETVIPQIIAGFDIATIASNREQINAHMKEVLAKELKGTPFIAKHIGVTDIVFPDIITRAKELAAERREKEDQLVAEQKLAMIEIENQRLREEANREVELMKAETKQKVAQKMLTPEYLELVKYETLQEFAKSDNKVIVPTELLDSLAVQMEMSK
jgi:hypothetical protein